MKLLAPLGLLGLLGVLALILIYIIKPNYQNKFLSSTFLWRMSLKRKKKRIPVSKLRNILMIICQILMITACAFILASPMRVLMEEKKENDYVLIIDSSASMRANSEGETRYQRAIVSAIDRIDALSEENGKLSVIVADSTPSFLCQRQPLSDTSDIVSRLEEMKNDELSCFYGSSDIDGAVALCGDILAENPTAKFVVFTDNNYYHYDNERIELVKIADDEEWNAAILDAHTELIDGTYSVFATVATYGVDKNLVLKVDVYGANKSSKNPNGSSFSYIAEVPCTADTTQDVIFSTDISLEKSEKNLYVAVDENSRAFSYDSVRVSIAENDSFKEDNNFFVYGGKKPVVRIQYASSLINNFMNGITEVIRNQMSDKWDIRIREVGVSGEPEYSGYDLYIFENMTPETVPTDGVVMFIDPKENLSYGGIQVMNTITPAHELSLSMGNVESDILDGVVPDNIRVTRYSHLGLSDDFDVLMTCDSFPMLGVKDKGEQKIVVMPFSLHYSNLAMIKEFPFLMLNIFKHFFPSTVESNAFEVGAEIKLNSRGASLSVLGGSEGNEVTLTSFPATYVADIPGTYMLSQTTYFGAELEENIYVKIPAVESNIKRTEDTIKMVYSEPEESKYLMDLLIYLAAALVVLAFAEWFLHTKEN